MKAEAIATNVFGNVEKRREKKVVSYQLDDVRYTPVVTRMLYHKVSILREIRWTLDPDSNGLLCWCNFVIR